MTEEEFARLQGLVGGVREDFAAFRAEVVQRLESQHQDVTRMVGQMDGLAAKVERIDSRVGLLEAWRSEKEQMILQAQQILEEHRRAEREARRNRIAQTGWVVGLVGVVTGALEWFFTHFHIVR